MKLFVVLSLLFGIATTGSSKCKAWSVVDFGAVGDGKADDSQAFLKSWKAVCGDKSRNPTLVVPKGKNFLLKPVTFQGPCQSPTIHVQVWGNIVAPSNPWRGDADKWIVFSHVNQLTVDGTGQIDGRGAKWWKSCAKKSKHCQRPSALSFNSCHNLRVSGLTHIDSQRNHISITGCHNATISNINIFAPRESPNTDGIDISSSSNIRIGDSFIGTGDDCVAINSGSSYIYITRVTCGPGHGISIGSLGKDGERAAVEQVHVKDCTFNSTQNGARIKTWEGGSGYARQISFRNITLIGTKNPIIIDQQYSPDASITRVKSAVQISDVTFEGFLGTTVTETPIDLRCSEYEGCTNVRVQHVHIKHEEDKSAYAVCNNVQGRATDTYPRVDCIRK